MIRLSPTQDAVYRRGIAAARQALHGRRDEFPGVTETRRVSQALATTKAVQR